MSEGFSAAAFLQLFCGNGRVVGLCGSVRANSGVGGGVCGCGGETGLSANCREAESTCH